MAKRKYRLANTEHRDVDLRLYAQIIEDMAVFPWHPLSMAVYFILL